LLEQNAEVVDKFHSLIQDKSTTCTQSGVGIATPGGCRAMKNKYVVAVFLLAMGLGIAFVVTAASIAANAAN
jgi:hypothetical protein